MGKLEKSAVYQILICPTCMYIYIYIYINTLTKMINVTLLFLPLFFMSWNQRSKTVSMYTKGLFLQSGSLLGSCNSDSETAAYIPPPCILSVSWQVYWWNQSSNVQQIKFHRHAVFIETDQRESGKSILHTASHSAGAYVFVCLRGKALKMLFAWSDYSSIISASYTFLVSQETDLAWGP